LDNSLEKIFPVFKNYGQFLIFLAFFEHFLVFFHKDQKQFRQIVLPIFGRVRQGRLGSHSFSGKHGLFCDIQLGQGVLYFNHSCCHILSPC
jgi:hypothetical protein